jgi:hypothetical protein
VVDMPVPDLRHRGRIATPHAGSTYNAYIGTERAGQRLEQIITAGIRTAQAVADTHRDWRRRSFMVQDDIEMRIKGRDLIHLGHGQAHFDRESLQVRSAQETIAILDQVQMLDKLIGLTRPVAEQCRDLVARRRIGLAPLVKSRRPPSPRSRAYPALVSTIIASIYHCATFLPATCSAQRLIEIGDEVIQVFDADGEANQLIADAERGPFFLGYGGMRHDTRVVDEAFDTAETLRQRKHLA